MNPDDHAGARRQPPRFVPTLTEVVDGLHQALAVEPAPMPPAIAPAVPKEWPVDAMVEAVVERAVDELLAQLADRLELHLASRMAQWRNEQAQQWVLEWLHAEMDGQLIAVRGRMEQLARDLLRDKDLRGPSK